MSEVTETKEVQVTYDSNVIAQKRVTWGDLGESIYKKEMNIQLMAQQSIGKIKIPSSIKDIPDAERMLKEVKADCAAIVLERKSITSKLDDLGKRLMVPEKSFEEPLLLLSNSIISIKKQEEQRINAENLKRDSINRCREFLTTTKNNMDAKFKQMLSDKVEKVYVYALGDGDIKPAEVNDFLKNVVLPKLSVEHFKIEYPLNTYTQFITHSEYAEMCKEIINIHAGPYIAEYENRLRVKFSDYAVAYENKIQALENSRIEAELEKQRIESEKANADIAAKLDAISASAEPIVTTGVKALKQSYEVEMPETLQSALTILTAFSAHLNLCQAKLRVSKWFSLTPAQCAKALSQVKCDDNTFAPAGIIFKQVDKL